MTITAWPQGVNTDFFEAKAKPSDNVVTTAFLSGRTIGWQKNTRNIMTLSCSIKLRVGTELAAFWNWYNNDLGGTAGLFTCAALGQGYYRFTDIPDPSDSTRDWRHLNLNIEEAY